MEIYYETAHYEYGCDYPIATAHDTLEDAIAFAEANGIDTISEIGGAWDEFMKCEWCGEWFTIPELDKGICSQCEAAIRSRGERW